MLRESSSGVKHFCNAVDDNDILHGCAALMQQYDLQHTVDDSQKLNANKTILETLPFWP